MMLDAAIGGLAVAGLVVIVVVVAVLWAEGERSKAERERLGEVKNDN